MILPFNLATSFYRQILIDCLDEDFYIASNIGEACGLTNYLRKEMGETFIEILEGISK